MKSMKLTSLMMAGILSVCMAMVPATIANAAEKYDLVILGGRVMDPETMFDAVRNVGVKDGKIAIITKDKISGKETIKAQGHVVAPGFIDTHVHVVDLPFGQKLMLRDGVTTPLDLEVGAYPVTRFYDTLQGRSQANYGATVSTIGIREKVFNPKYNSETGIFTSDMYITSEESFADMKWSATVPTADQITQINQMVEEGLKQGALGIGVPVGYMIGGVTSQETTAWQRLAGKYGRATFPARPFFQSAGTTTGILGFEEMIANARDIRWRRVAAAHASAGSGAHHKGPRYG